MAIVDVRRLAAVDMHGLSGSTTRRRVIRAGSEVVLHPWSLVKRQERASWSESHDRHEGEPSRLSAT
jgi:hypothetical protein